MTFSIIIRKTTMAAALGNMLEFYSFTLFSLFLPTLLPLFFPSTDYFASLLSGYLVFAVGFFAYPFGSLLFGYIGDQYGRKIALMISISLMTIATSLIGLLPSYEQAGVFSPLALFCCRILQGICAGGEAIGAGILVVEHAKKESTMCFLGSIPAAFGTMGALQASLIVYLFFKYDLPLEWWRIPFIAALLLGLIGFYFRQAMVESPIFKKETQTLRRLSTFSVWEVFKKTPFSLIPAAAVGALGTVPFYLVIGFLNIYLSDIGAITSVERATINMTLLFFCTLTLPLAGYIADRIGYFNLMIISSFSTLLYAYPFFYMVFKGSFLFVLMAELILLGISQLYVAPINAFISKLFPTHLRYKGAALGYCLGMALCGGTAPYISTLLIKISGNNIMPFCYLIFVSFLGLVGVLLGQRIITKNLSKQVIKSSSDRLFILDKLWPLFSNKKRQKIIENT
jgi:MHS family proline/betaine transporter-like MFS transporter